MIMATIKDIFKEYLEEYLKASRKEKGGILKHICFVTKRHRKSAVRKFGRMQKKRKNKQNLGDPSPGRKEYYGPEVTVVLKEVWEIGDEVCAELLHPMVKEYVAILQRDAMWKHGNDATEKLQKMSEGTMKRRIGNFRKARGKSRGFSATKPSHLKKLVPIFTGPWKELPPGHGQIDTVLHNNKAEGDAVYTVNYTDAATMVTVPRAQWNKGQKVTKESMEAMKLTIEEYLEHWFGAHPDTGSEFINYVAFGWFKENNIDFSRSRPGHKNDNMYIEERNGHVIRKHVGYKPFTCPEVVPVLNAYYDILIIYLIHFVATRRLLSKEKQGSKYIKVYEKKAKTPYQRILEHPAISEKQKEKLKLIYDKLNPLTLKKEIDKRLNIVYDTQTKFGNPAK
jgi:hypothetical protein